MPTMYAVLQYLPDPVRDERINIGIVAFEIGSREQIRCRFLKNWSRVEAFAGEGIGFIHEFAASCKVNPLTQEDLNRIAKWDHSIQLKDFAASLLPIDECLEKTAGRMLVEPEGET